MWLELGCKWTVEYFLSGVAGGLVAVLVLPGCYTTMPSRRKVHGETRIYWGVTGRLVVAGIVACVVDCSSRNAFFAGFWAWHVCKWFSERGWELLRNRLESTFGKAGRK